MSVEPRASNVDSVKIERVVVIRSLIGEGVENNPKRGITEYYTMDGELIVRQDPWLDLDRPLETGLSPFAMQAAISSGCAT